MHRIISAFILVLLSLPAAADLTYVDLVNRLTDLEEIAMLPQQGQVCKLWSSYDRKSRYDEKTRKYVNWDSNGDGFGGDGWIRKENGKLVLAEMEGPGCIWRIWSATPKNGHVRIYLDGSDTPAVDLPFVDYFSCTQPPFNRPALVYHVASGKNNFVPIPFAKSCKIVADKDYGEFHHFTYTLYPEGTVVPTFSMKLSEEEGAALDAANQRLSNRGADFAAALYPDAENEKYTLKIKPGGNQQITLSGARAIVSLKARVKDLPESVEQQREVLRQLVFSVAWDGQAEPAVWSPLGDFFGTGPGANLYKSLPMGMTKEGFYSNWFMPFAKQAAISIANDGSESRQVEIEITHTALKKPADTYGRFHAKWHRNAFLPSEPERWIDWTMLTTQGQGRFVGVNLQIWNPKGGWWGEGDEKFFVDGEKFPSTFGTGSEDYFGYAWSDGALFEAAYHCQPISENNAGHISVARWHIVDNIPFQKSFEGCIEKYWADDRPTQYTCVAYWYLKDGGTDAYTPVELSQRINYYTQLKYPLEVDGTIVLEKPVGHLEAQWVGNHPAAKWDDDRHLWWTPEKVGDRIKLLVDAPADGSYKLITCLTKANDYGIVQFILNDEKIGEPFDLYSKVVTNTGRIDLGICPLKKGRNVLTVEIVGSNPDAIRRYMFGMDYLKIRSQSASSAEENKKPAFNVGQFIHIYNPSVGENEPWYINDHCFIFGPDKQWHLFGITRQEPMSPADEDNFAHAVSNDLYTTTGWTKKPFALSTDSSAGEAHLWAPYVFEHDGLYYMYYCAGGKNSQEYQLKLATSKDLYTWQRHPANPMYVDGFDARDPFILRLADKWVMYYTATSKPEGGNHNVCAIESQDLIHWGNKKVVFTDPSIGTYGGPTESPFVVRRGKYYYLFIGPRDGYKGTCVYRSEDPLNWTIEQEVGRIDSHAAEVVRDKDGKWYVSHCGWGQGGVFLAPLTWNDGVDDKDTSLMPPVEKKQVTKPLVQVGQFFNIYDPAEGGKKWWINDHCFTRALDGTWHLFGITDQKAADAAPSPHLDFLAHAQATTLTRTEWQKQPFALKADPSLGEVHIWAPHIIRHDGVYYMYYCAGGPKNTEFKIQLATSKDLLTWQRHAKNPMVVDGYDARDPFILRVGNQWVMYYTATSKPEGGNHTVEAVFSEDLVNWSGKRRVYTDPGTGTWGGDTESPFVVRRGEYYYLFIGPGASYVSTKVFRSKDPFQWTPADQVAQLRTHAAEIVRDIDGTWYISHCGIDRGGVYLAPLIWNDGLDNADTSLKPAEGIAAPDLSDKIQTVRIPMETYHDKMIAGWLGQMVAVAWGFPVEFKFLGEIMPVDQVPVWKPEMINDAFGQDDLYVEMTFLKTLEDYGLNASMRQAGIDFANSLYPLWHANEAGRINLRKGIAPPDSGHPRFNSHADDIDYQIEADFAGLISPALPNQAVTLGNTFGRLMNYGDGLYGGHFVAAMYSIAFIESDPQKIVSEALKYIPYESRYAEAIRDVIAWHRQYPDDWTKTWELVNQKYHLNPDYRAFSCDKGKFNIDAKINGAYIVMGLLYGQGNIEKTIIISMQCGQDNDCNPSNAAGILFTTMGYKNLPQIYKAFDETKKFIYTPYNMPQLFDVCRSLAHQAVKHCGGTIEKDASGSETLVIPIQAPRPNCIERAFDAGPIADSRYTPEEMSQIKTELRLDSEQPKPSAKAGSVFKSFVTARGDQLIDENGPIRFISFNVPNLHVNEDRMDFAQTNAWSLTDEFEITDALETVRQMGGNVIRLYTLTIRSKDDPVDAPRHIDAPGQFNEEAFKSLDIALAVANQKGVRLIIPFIDNHKWFGGVPAMADFRGRKKSAFWTDRQLFEDYKQIVDYTVNRTNSITGVKYKDDKAILAWETGNELASPQAWVSKAAAYIKSVDGNHLVVDGTLLTVLRDSAIEDTNIDIVTTHHYDKNPKKTISQIQKSVRKSKGRKPYFVGEFGFVPVKDVKAILDEVAGNDSIAGALLWSLRFHRSDGGFYWHSEPFGGDLFKAYHYPGFASGSAYDEIETMELMRRMGFQIRGLEVPQIEIPAAPVLLDITDPAAISWQGSAGAQSYSIERADSKDGPWTTIADKVSDADTQYRPLFSDTSAQAGKSWYYRVIAQNSAGVSQPSNIIGPVAVTHQTLVDEMADMKKIHGQGSRFSLQAGLARRFKEDVNRLEGRKNSSVVYKTDAAISAFKVYCFFEKKAGTLKFAGSADGTTFSELPARADTYFTDKGGYDYSVPVVYEGVVSAQQKIQYLKIEFADTAQLSRVEIQYGRQ